MQQLKAKRQCGTLHLTIHAAKAIPDIRALGTQDPYCSVSIGRKVVIGKTIVNGGTNPSWEELFIFHNVEQDMDLRIEIIDKQTFKDKHIGHVMLPLQEAIQRCLNIRNTVTVDLPVHTKSGSCHGMLRVSLHYAPIITPEALQLSARFSADTATTSPPSWPGAATATATSTGSSDSGTVLPPQLAQDSPYTSTGGWAPQAAPEPIPQRPPPPAPVAPWEQTPLLDSHSSSGAPSHMGAQPATPATTQYTGQTTGPAQYAAPAPPQYAAPADPQYAAPTQYAAPVHPQYAAPAQHPVPAPAQYPTPAHAQYHPPAPAQHPTPGPAPAPTPLIIPQYSHGSSGGGGVQPTPGSRMVGPTPRSRARALRPGCILRPPYCDRDGMQDYNPAVEWKPLGSHVPEKTWTTWLVTKLSNSAQCVLKRYDKSRLVAADHEYLKELIAIMSSLQGHPNMVQLDEPWEDEHYLYIVTEYCPCGTWLNEMCTKQRKPEESLYGEREAAGILRGIYDLVSRMHDHGIVHRSLNAKHIMITQEEMGGFVYKVVDFRMAIKMKNDEPLQDASGCQLLWAAPEQLLGSYGKQADMWSCGVMLYAAMCGELPYFGQTVSEVYEAQKYPVDLDFPPWSSASEDARDCVRWLLHRDPKKRATADEVKLHKWLTLDTGAVKQPWESMAY